MNYMMNHLFGGFMAVDYITDNPEWEWVDTIVSAIQTVLWPLLIVVAAAGMIYAVVIGINMAKADSTEKREEAKKRLINVIIGIVVVIALILLFQLLISAIIPALLPDVAGEVPPETGTQ